MFLNGDLDEDFYMTHPDGYIDEDHEHLVCKLQRSLCGLKQSSRMWNKTINDSMIKIGNSINVCPIITFISSAINST